VIADLRRENRGRQVRRHGGGGNRACGGDRVAFVWHGRRTAAAFARWLEGFCDIGLHHQLDVAANLAAGACDDGEH
jgi:hypothetical protein